LGGELGDAGFGVGDDGVVLFEFALAFEEFGVAAASFVAVRRGVDEVRRSQYKISGRSEETGGKNGKTHLLISLLFKSSCSVLLL
jgi:hypothetical protein